MRNKLMLVMLLVLGTICVPARAQGNGAYIAGTIINRTADVIIVKSQNKTWEKINDRNAQVADHQIDASADVAHHQIDASTQVAMAQIGAQMEQAELAAQTAIELANIQSNANRRYVYVPHVNTAGRNGKGPMVK